MQLAPGQPPCPTSSARLARQAIDQVGQEQEEARGIGLSNGNRLDRLGRPCLPLRWFRVIPNPGSTLARLSAACAPGWGRSSLGQLSQVQPIGNGALPQRRGCGTRRTGSSARQSACGCIARGFLFATGEIGHGQQRLRRDAFRVTLFQALLGQRLRIERGLLGECRLSTVEGHDDAVFQPEDQRFGCLLYTSPSPRD